VLLERISADATHAGRAPNGRWIGLLGVRGEDGRARLLRVFAALQARADFDRLGMPDLINALTADGASIEVQYVHGHWRGVNDMDEFRHAADFAHGQTPFSGAATETRHD
jgi:phosphoenolpyruvate phosphomutase